MLSRFRQTPKPAVPPGQRVYAIGDVHGEGGLLTEALRLIKEDSADRDPAEVTLVLLGDLIDRGPDAADLLRIFARTRDARIVVIKGNHEAALIDAYRGDRDVMSAWLPFGAAATLSGFGITAAHIDSSMTAFEAALHDRIAPDLIAWLESLPGKWECGDYYFTHAGIRPGVALDDQDHLDLLWIREPFLSSKQRHGKVIVHGHTIEPGRPALGGNRIGIDTGAHEHGLLTVLGLEGQDQWLLQSRADVEVHHAPAARPKDRGRMVRVRRPVALDEIATSLVAIVNPPAATPDPALQLDASLAVADAAKRSLGTRGVAAAGFALVLAMVGGAYAWRTQLPPSPTDTVTVAVPDERPVARATANVVDTPPVGRHAVSRKPWRPVARPAQSDAADDATSTNAGAPSPRLYGAALEKALEEDRSVTRRLNEDELERQGSTDRR